MDQLKKHLDHALSGNNKINPDEQNHFLGTFRERILVAMTIAQMKSEANFKHLKCEIIENKKHSLTMKINGNVSSEIQAKYMNLATLENVEFTIINQHVGQNLADLGLVLHGKEAINREFIDLEHLYPPKDKNNEFEKTATDAPTKKKKSFWQRLFH